MGYSRNSFLLVVIFLITNLLFTESFSSIQKDSYRRVIASNNKIFMGTDKTFNQLEKLTKKLFIPILMSSVLLTAIPVVSNAYWDENNEWVELQESSVQDVWGERLKKASTMSPKDIFMAAKGAGNNEKRVGPETKASMKRRAMAGCRTPEYRNLVPGGISEMNCNIKVNKGDSQFMLNILDPSAIEK
mmetsp:Transcript_7066/g.7177  ORF Transcript_7066/g.7177 Transcript_7066/m.7177 type:complete len:188 (-) Transcript_7066:244-807(-)